MGSGELQKRLVLFISYLKFIVIGSKKNVSKGSEKTKKVFNLSSEQKISFCNRQRIHEASWFMAIEK